MKQTVTRSHPFPAVWLMVAVMLVPLAVRAANVGLGPSQQVKLRQLVAEDPSAAKVAKQVIKQADEAVKRQPQPLERIRTSGLLKSDPVKKQTHAATQDLPTICALSLAHVLTGNIRYAETARRFILAWARVNKPTGSPIDETKLEPLIEAYDELQDTFPPVERKRVDQWLLSIAKAEMASRKVGKATGMNNWQSHRLKVVGLIGFTLEDKPLEQWAVKGFREQVAQNLRADGSSFDFHERDALHYHLYDIEPLLTLARVLHRAGYRVYDEPAVSGASLHKSVQFVLPYTRGAFQRTEWLRSRVRFDQQRAEAGETKFTPGKKFEPLSASKALELAQFFDPALTADIRKLQDKPDVRFPSQRVLLNEVMRNDPTAVQPAP